MCQRTRTPCWWRGGQGPADIEEAKGDQSKDKFTVKGTAPLPGHAIRVRGSARDRAGQVPTEHLVHRVTA